jgi:hypothetical protein
MNEEKIQKTRQITDDWEISQDTNLDLSSFNTWCNAESKPPNEIWVEVLDKSEVVEAMAFYGRDGYLPHWQLRNGTSCHPSRFNKWRHKKQINPVIGNESRFKTTIQKDIIENSDAKPLDVYEHKKRLDARDAELKANGDAFLFYIIVAFILAAIFVWYVNNWNYYHYVPSGVGPEDFP